MSIVAQQYNILAESLRRGLAGYQQGQLEEMKLSAGIEQQRFERKMLMNREQREQGRYEVERGLDPLREKLLKTQVAGAEQEVESKRLKRPKEELEYLEYAEARKRSLSPANYDYVVGVMKSRGMPGQYEGVGGQRLLDETLRTAGYEVDKKTGSVSRNGQPVNQYQADNDFDLNIGLNFQDPKEALLGMQQAAEKDKQFAKERGIKDLEVKMDKVLEFTNKKLKDIDDNPAKVYNDRFHYALQASMASKNPEKWLPGLKILAEEQKAKMAASDVKPGAVVLRKWRSPQGTIEEYPMDKTNFQHFLNFQIMMREKGYEPVDESVGDMAARTLIEVRDTVNKGGIMSPHQAMILHTFAQSQNISTYEAIVQAVGLDPQFMALKQAEAKGTVKEGSAQDYLTKRSLEINKSLARAYEQYQEEQRTGKNTAGTVDANTLKEFDSTTIEQARKNAREKKWSKDKYFQYLHYKKNK